MSHRAASARCRYVAPESHADESFAAATACASKISSQSLARVIQSWPSCITVRECRLQSSLYRSAVIPRTAKHVCCETHRAGGCASRRRFTGLAVARGPRPGCCVERATSAGSFAATARGTVSTFEEAASAAASSFAPCLPFQRAPCALRESTPARMRWPSVPQPPRGRAAPGVPPACREVGSCAVARACAFDTGRAERCNRSVTNFSPSTRSAGKSRARQSRLATFLHRRQRGRPAGSHVDAGGSPRTVASRTRTTARGSCPRIARRSAPTAASVACAVRTADRPRHRGRPAHGRRGRARARRAALRERSERPLSRRSVSRARRAPRPGV